MTIDSVGLDGVGGVSLSQTLAPDQTNLPARQEMSHIFEGAIHQAVAFPASASDPTRRPNQFLERPDQNVLLREQPSTSQTGDAGTSENKLNDVTDRFFGLYIEMTHFQVAWSVAKRSGRDIETLLRAQ